MRKKIIIIIVLLLVTTSIVFLAGCYKDKTIIPDTGAEVTRAVSFSADIIPIFDKNCSLSGCHSPGGKSPDLTAANAFNSLSVGNYFDINAPENSTIYQWITGKRSTQMPPTGINIDNNALILAWIKQGAQNN